MSLSANIPPILQFCCYHLIRVKLLCRYHCIVTQHSLKRLRKSKILECVKQALTTAFFFTNPTKDKNDKTIENTILSKEEEKDAHSCSIPPTWKQFAYMTKCVTKMCNTGFSSLGNFSLNQKSYPFRAMNWHLPHEAFAFNLLNIV